jgi:glycosyltransferase involved in cell wall biosynthesis
MINSSGVGVYLMGCLPFFLQSNNDFLLLGNATQLSIYSSNTNVRIINCNIKPFSLEELLLFPVKTLNQINNTDLFYSPFFNIFCCIKIPIYTTIHDIIFPDMPECISKIGLIARMWFFHRAYKKSQKIFTVSEFSKSRIEHHLGIKKQVIVTHSAIQQMFLEYRSSEKKQQKTETIVFVGNIKKHKGLDYLLDAFLLAKNEGLPHKLIIIGSKENFSSSDNTIFQKIDTVGSDSVMFTGYIPDTILMEYLSSAALLIQPSLYEGFCLPPLEAMVLGTHALISDIPVFKEIYSDYPVSFFHAGDMKDLKVKIMALLLNKPISSPVLSEELLIKYTFNKTVSTIIKELQ